MSIEQAALLYPAHLAELRRRADEALARGGFDHLVVPSGTRTRISRWHRSTPR